MINGRRKGKGAELEVARIISDWWAPFEPGTKFVRTPLSGGWSSAKVRGEFRASGDLMTTSHLFPFVIEVKRREEFSWKNLLSGYRSPVWGWWAQARRAAAEQNGVALLWLRRNEEDWRLFLDAALADAWYQKQLVVARVISRPIEFYGWSDETLGERPPAAVMLPAAALLAAYPGGICVASREFYDGEQAKAEPGSEPG